MIAAAMATTATCHISRSGGAAVLVAVTVGSSTELGCSVLGDRCDGDSMVGCVEDGCSILGDRCDGDGDSMVGCAEDGCSVLGDRCDDDDKAVGDSSIMILHGQLMVVLMGVEDRISLDYSLMIIIDCMWIFWVCSHV